MNRITLAIFLAAFLAACGDAQRGDSGAESQATAEQAGESAGGQSDEGQTEGSMGSGETDQSSGADMPDLATDNVAFLERLGLIRGHLFAGNALYQQGETEMSATHMKHPRDELYAGLVPAIEARGLSTFDAELSALAEAVESGAESAEVEQAWRELDEAIAAAERGVDASAREQFLAIAGLLDTSAEEYKVGVFEGMVEDVHEYQDAWGFQQIAFKRVGQIEAETDAERSMKAEAAVTVSSLDDLWPNLDPAGPVDGDAGRIVSAAERIRSAASASD